MKKVIRMGSFFLSLFILFFCGMLFPFVYNGGHLSHLFMVGIYLAFFFMPIGTAMLAYGVRNAFWGFAGLSIFWKREPLAPLQEMILKNYIRWIYATGVITFVGQIMITAGYIAGELALISEKLAHSLVSFLVMFILAELVVRPALARSALLREEIATGESHPSFKQLWVPTVLFFGVIGIAIGRLIAEIIASSSR